MATPAITLGQKSSFQDRSSVKDNIDDRLDFLTPTDLPFLTYLGVMSGADGATFGANSLKFPCTQERHTWLNDDLVPSVSSVGTAYTATDATIVVATGEGSRFDVSDLVMIGDTVLVVTSLSSDTLTTTVVASDADHAVGEVIYLIGNARVEGTAASVVTGRTTDFGSTENFTQIFMSKVDLNGTEQSTERWGIGGDPFAYQENKRLKELAIQLEKAAIYGMRNSSYPSTNSTRRYMGGLAYYVRDGSGANDTDASGADLDEILLNDLLQDVWTDGGMPDTIMCGARQKRMMNAFLSPYVQVSRTEGTAGILVGSYESDFGTLNVVMNRWMKPSDLLVLTREYIGIGPLAGNGNSRAFSSTPLPKDGDYDRSMILGEYTMEVRNAIKAFGWLENLSVS